MPTAAQKDSDMPIARICGFSILGPKSLTKGCQVGKGVFFTFVLLLTSIVYSQEYWFAGTGASLEPSEELLGVNIRGYYGINEEFCFGPEISIFPYQQLTEEEELSLLDLNVNVHYIFEVAHHIGIYPISGINYSIENARELAPLEEEERISAFGINYGAGLHYNINKVFIFAEYKGIIGALNAPFITAGVIFDLSKNESEH